MAEDQRDRKWRELGGALQSVRRARDLGQKEVIDLSGEQMGDRTLRSYERGEERPSRDRLLRMLTRSFEVRRPSEIDRFLRLAGYACLTDAEIAQRGLTELVRVAPGSPAGFRIEVSTLVVSDGQGREIWRHQFPTRLAQALYDQQSVLSRCAFADLDGDGGTETLFVYMPVDWGSVGSTLFCFAEDGSVKWHFVPGKVVKDSTGREYYPPYFVSNVQILPALGAAARVMVSSNHYLHNPNQIAILDSRGKLLSEYWHSGHLLHAAFADLNGDGIEEILLAGVNNGYRQATMVVFDPRQVSGVSTQPGRQILGFAPGTEKAVALFPKTCVAQNAPYNRVMELRVTREQRIMLAVAEGVSEQRNPGVMIYELDFALNVVNARPDSHLQENHRLLEAQGVLDHSWTEDESRQLRSQVVVKGRL